MDTNEATLDYEQRQAIAADLQTQLATDLAGGVKRLHEYDNHPSEELRRDLLAMTWRYGLASTDSTARRAMVNFMLDVFTHGTSFLQGQAITFLQDFQAADFDERALARLDEISWAGEYGNEIIRLIGIANVRSRTDDLEATADTDWDSMPRVNLYGSETWAAALALARFGDRPMAERVIATVKTEPNLITRATQLFAELGYTRHPLAFDALRSYLGSMERMERIKDHVPGLPEGLYAAQQFALYVEGCPVTGEDVDEEDLPAIRDWAEAQKNWTIRK